MKAKAKSSSTPHPVWVQGEYKAGPPAGTGGCQGHPTSHYIDKGGCPGANVYEVSPETLCMDTGAVDLQNRRIYECDILLYETDNEVGYFTVLDRRTAVDIINGEILETDRLQPGTVKVIGSIIDHPDFIDGIRHCVDAGEEVPYLPALDVIGTSLPFIKLSCPKCGHVTLSCSYMARHKGCGGYFTVGFTTKVYRKGAEKEKPPA